MTFRNYLNETTGERDDEPADKPCPFCGSTEAGLCCYDATGDESLRPMGAEPDPPVRCTLCGAEVATVEAAIDAGWYPSYDVVTRDADGKEIGWSEVDGPVCAACRRERAVPRAGGRAAGEDRRSDRRHSDGGVGRVSGVAGN